MTNTIKQTKPREDFYWLTKQSRDFLSRGYLVNGQTAEDRIKEIAEHAEKRLNMPGFAEKFYHYMARGYYSLATPVWCNYGNKRGAPISCFGSVIGDSVVDIASTTSEVMMMSKLGGGTSAYFGKIRPRGSAITNNGESNGRFSFATLFDRVINVVSQGSSRRGMMAGYIDVDHPDIGEWLEIHRKGNPIQTMMYGVNVDGDFLEACRNGDQQKLAIWRRVLQRRSETGIPYIFFKDNANKGRPDVYKDKEMPVLASNLCTEIMLPSSEEESFVCCLGSMNIDTYDEWKNTDAVKIKTYFLDTVISEFIDFAKDVPYMEKAVRFAERHRAIGIGVLGWHSYLQSHSIPFESFDAKYLNIEIFKHIQEESYKASEELADLFGEPEILKGYGRRNTTTMTVAPTKSSSFIIGGVSASVEPIRSNYYVADLAKIKGLVKNKELQKVLKAYGKDTPEIWDTIAKSDGSVQHLDFLTPHEKNVFRTFAEIDMNVVIDQAAQRQKYIDQGQSLNLMIDPDTSPKDVNALYLKAHASGIKALYYHYSISQSQKLGRALAQCASCEA